MLRGASGYTIIELTIVLAVSIAVLVSASVAISGTNSNAQFDTSMHDINSKFQSWISNVNYGFPGSGSQNTCTTASGRPQINSAGTATPECIYLGKVIQAATTSDPCPSGCDRNTLYAYSIFGRRIDPSTGQTPATLADVDMTPAVGTANTGNQDLTEAYTLPGGTTIKSITSASGSPEGHLLGIFQSFGSYSSANGAQDLKIFSGMPVNALPANNTSGDTMVSDCIKTAGCGITTPLTSWQACFQSAYSATKTALITVSSTSGIGVHTNLEFKTCT